MRKWIRRIWITAGICFMAWLGWNAQAHGVDVDPVAIRVATENLAENGLAGRATLQLGPLASTLVLELADRTALITYLRGVTSPEAIRAVMVWVRARRWVCPKASLTRPSEKATTSSRE